MKTQKTVLLCVTGSIAAYKIASLARLLKKAGVDVTDPEPLPAEHPLWKCKNCLVTPHISGFYHLKQTHDRIIAIAARNLVNEVEAAIMKRLPNAESFATYQSLAVHPYPYYYIQIHKYLVFYVVIDDVMEVRRIIYSRRNMTKQF